METFDENGLISDFISMFLYYFGINGLCDDNCSFEFWSSETSMNKFYFELIKDIVSDPTSKCWI